MATEEETAELIGGWLAQGQALGGSDDPLIKRAHRRFPTPEDFFLKPAESGDFAETFAKGYNISASSLGVICRHFVPGDVAVLVHSSIAEDDELWACARVVHCTRTLGGYKLGLEFQY